MSVQQDKVYLSGTYLKKRGKNYMAKRNEIWQSIELEIRKAKKAYPDWPQHPCGQAMSIRFLENL